MAGFGNGWTAAAGLALVAALSGCTTSGQQHGRAARTPSVLSACDGVADCHPDMSADLDGDGRPDEVAVVGHPIDDGVDGPYWSPDAAPTLRVATATTVLTYRVILAGPVFGHVVLGAAQVDGVAGDELLVGFADGAHGHPATVVTDHGAGLRTLPSPDPYSGEPGAPEGSWGADSSIMSNLGWRCLPGGRVEEFIGVGGSAAAKPLTYTMWHQTWRWRDSKWWPVGRRWLRKHAPGDALTAEYHGWTGCGSFVAERPYE